MSLWSTFWRSRSGSNQRSFHFEEKWGGIKQDNLIHGGTWEVWDNQWTVCPQSSDVRSREVGCAPADQPQWMNLLMLVSDITDTFRAPPESRPKQVEALLVAPTKCYALFPLGLFTRPFCEHNLFFSSPKPDFFFFLVFFPAPLSLTGRIRVWENWAF